jgi:tRNA dimethylallyltransferase
VPLVDPEKTERIVLDVERGLLDDRIARRARAMVAGGALDEARAMLALGLDGELPAMKAIGLAALAEHLAGRSSLDAAVAAMAAETRRYAKRQVTWFRHQMPGWRRLQADGLP